jgi:hypothetical protein
VEPKLRIKEQSNIGLIIGHGGLNMQLRETEGSKYWVKRIDFRPIKYDFF